MVQAAATTLQEYGPVHCDEKISSAAMIAHDRVTVRGVQGRRPLDAAAFGLAGRNFGQLSPAELGALLVLFDRDGDGTISCDEFKSMWMRPGRAQLANEAPLDEAVQRRARGLPGRLAQAPARGHKSRRRSRRPTPTGR